MSFAARRQENGQESLVTSALDSQITVNINDNGAVLDDTKIRPAAPTCFMMRGHTSGPLPSLPGESGPASLFVGVCPSESPNR